MPTIKTGNAEWDQNLNTLGAALFPDPSKEASAYYYGTKSRESLLESAKTQNQMAAGNTQLGQTFGRAPNPTYRPGPFGTSIMNDPYAAAPAPAPPGAPVAPVQALPTLAGAMTTTPPAAMANAVVAGVENNASSGPGPEPTGSNGSIPQNGPGMFRPGSVTSAGGGGVVMAGPAAADGTPAPAAFNFGQAVALGIAAGQQPAQAYAVALGTLGNMVKNGQMALPLAEQIAAFYGAPQMRVQTQAGENALAVGAQTQAATTQRTGMEIAGRKDVAGMATTFVPDPDPVKAAQGVGRLVPLAQQQVPGGFPGTNPAAVAQSVQPVQVQPGGPGTPPISMPQGQAQAGKVPLYEPNIASAEAARLGAKGNYVHPDRPTIILERTFEQAQREGLRPAVGPETVSGVVASAVQNATTDEQAAAIAARRLEAAPPKTVREKADENAQVEVLINRTLANTLPAGPPKPWFSGEAGEVNALPRGASPDLQPVVNDLTRQYMARGPTKNDPTRSANAALGQLLQEGYIDVNQPFTKKINKEWTDPRTGDISQKEHAQVELLDPKTKQPLPPGSRPLIKMKTMTDVVPGAPAATPAPTATVTPGATGAPAGAIGMAPAGTPDGPRTIGGKPHTVRGGYIFPG